MDFKICKFQDLAVEIVSSKKLTNNEINQLFGKYGKIEQITECNGRQIILYDSSKAARICKHDTDNIIEAFRKLNFDGYIGDTISKNDHTINFGKIKDIFKLLTLKKTYRNNNNSELPSSSGHLKINNTGNYVPECSSPSLLNIRDSGIHLAYCHHDVLNLKVKSKVQKLNRFNDSTKKYMDATSSASTQELILMHLPPHLKKEDIYKLFGKIELAAVELKSTNKNNISYANIKLKAVEDFRNISKMLNNHCIDDTKITVIPVTKIMNPFTLAN